MRLAAVTVAHGRHDHLRRQREGLDAGTRHPDARVLVALGDPAAGAAAGPAADVLELAFAGRLPVARARNAGAAAAIDAGAELLVFLDVDVVPGRELLERYVAAAGERPDALLSGPVAYLPPGRHDLADLPSHPPHPARPAPPPGRLEECTRPELFWSLSFAVTAAVWQRIGGFDERYAGYGAEDTDFGLRARAAGVPLLWVGGALGYHQHHPVSSPPVEHLDDILANGRIFRRTWGFWPMGGWLSAFEQAGLVAADGEDWVRLTPAGHAPDPLR